MALVYFVTLAGLFLRKLLPVWSTAIPGGQQDTSLFLWNGWWFHYAIAQLKTNPYHTTFLFFPYGARLISHDFPLWMNLVTFAGQKAGCTLIAASNLWFVSSWILAGYCCYGLAKEAAGNAWAAIAAGTLAMTHSYTLARAMQNWGQFNIYGIALFLWMLLRARRLGTTSAWILAGASLAWTAACHYYFFVFSVLVWLAVAAYDLKPHAHTFSLRTVPKMVDVMLLGLAGVAGLAAIWIHFHPQILVLRGMAIGLESPENPLFFMWVLLIVWGAAHIKFGYSPIPLTTDLLRKRLKWHFLLAGTAFLLLSPLVWETVRLALEGGYPRQHILWKTPPRGVNLFALLMPNALQVWWGPAVSRWIVAHDMHPQEQAAAIGWVCLAVVLWAKPWKTGRRAALWLTLALFSTTLALGTHLHFLRYNTWCPLPFFVLRMVPLIGNIRMPERWMALATVAWSVVLAQSLLLLSQKRGWPIARVSLIATSLILLENWPGLPMKSPAAPLPLYHRLRELSAGAVLPLPIYIGDSSIGTGNSIERGWLFPWGHLWAQTFYEKPMVGGYIGRISRRVMEAYKSEPYLKTLLDLEEGNIANHAADPKAGAQAVKTLGFRYVLAYTDATEPSALQYAIRSLPLHLVATEGPVQLFEIRQ